MTSIASTTVLVTGGSGFIGSYVILSLLSAGYSVRTTVRNLSREPSVRSSLSNGGAAATDLERLSFVAASLDTDEGWPEAVKGCSYVHHVASPFPLELPKHEDDIITPAREGALRVLKAASAAGVKRVALTSSFAAVNGGVAQRKEAFTEVDWTALDNPIAKVAPYGKSKTIAERAAWDFVNSDANTSKMELVTVLPVLVSGPVLSNDISPSSEVVKRVMNGSMPGAPNINFVFVDVRDVASLHILAMIRPEAAGQRFIAANNDPAVSILQVGKIIKSKRPQNAKVPTFKVPNFIVHLLAIFDKPVRQVLPDLGKVYQANNRKARETLGWQPRGTEESLVDTADSLVKYGLL